MIYANGMRKNICVGTYNHWTEFLIKIKDSELELLNIA